VVFKRPPNLFGCRAKIGWAQHYLDTLEQHVESFLEGHRYAVLGEPDAERGCYVARLKNPPTIPAPDWALMIGDCVHNARAALDYLAWELAGADPDDRETYFPICLTEDSYRSTGARRVAALPEQARTLIEKMQPYHAPDPAKHGLWALQQLDIADKHKLLTVTAVVAEAGELSLRIPGGIDSSRFRWTAVPDVALEHDAVLGELHVGLPLPEMTVELELAPGVAFGESHGWGRRMFVISNLQTILDDVEAIGLLFKQRFDLRDS
jgi:hypothetical protein